MRATMLNSRMAGNFDKMIRYMDTIKTAVSTQSPVLTHGVLKQYTDWYYAYVNS